jgi:hypothetical protein
MMSFLRAAAALKFGSAYSLTIPRTLDPVLVGLRQRLLQRGRGRPLDVISCLVVRTTGMP